MKDFIKKAINDLFIQESGRHVFIQRCKKNLEMIDSLEEVIESQNLIVIESLKINSFWPSTRGYYEYPQLSLKQKDAGQKFYTEINISKLIPAYYIQHDFEAENLAISPIEPVLGGFGNSAYTREQYTFHERVSRILNQANLIELSFQEFNETIHDLTIPSDIKMFGPQVTVDSAFFNDLYGFCNGTIGTSYIPPVKPKN